MGRFDEIKNKINANINENGEQRITGQVLNEVLIDEVNTIDEVISELEESIGQGGSITIDSEMSDTSENAVSNKVIKEYVDSFIPSEFSEEFNNDFTN